MRYDYTKVKSKNSGAIKKITLALLIAGAGFAVYYFWPEAAPPEPKPSPRKLWQVSFTQIRKSLLQTEVDTDQKQNTDQKKNQPVLPLSRSTITDKKIIFNYIFSSQGRQIIVNIDKNGQVKHTWHSEPDALWEKNLNGHYLMRYYKTGQKISLFNNQGHEIWAKQTRNYPYLAPSGNYFTLMSADSGGIAVYNRYQSKIFANLAHGIGLTGFQWSDDEKTLGLSFLDGTLVLAHVPSQSILTRSIHQKKNPVPGFIKSQYIAAKGIALSPRGLYFAVHAASPPGPDFILWYALSPYDQQDKESWRPRMIKKITLDKGYPETLPMALSGGANPYLIYRQGEQFWLARKEKPNAQLNSILRAQNKTQKAKSTENSKPAQPVIARIDPANFVFAKTSSNHDLALVFSDGQKLHFYILNHSEENTFAVALHETKIQSRYGRAIFMQKGRQVLLETDTGLEMYDLYPPKSMNKTAKEK